MDVNFQYVSVTEAAVDLGLTVGRVRQLLLAGILDGHKLGGKAWAIPVVALERLKRSHRKAGRPKQTA